MFIEEYIKQSIEAKQAILENKETVQTIKKVADVIVNAYKNNKKVLTAGNGGSAADAQHIAAELVSRFYFDRPGLAAIALTTDTSILTAVGNDYGYDMTFSRQIQANAQEGDIFIGISTSGNSKNVIEAINEAKNKGLITVGLVGQKDCKMDSLCDYIIKVPTSDTPKIQESHIMIGHIICAIVEDELFGEK
ncbi:MAG: D-sedoheptulose 7-phosphate isomerase [Clostridium sp.]|nr:D-sedoheptulose 7-phosphate isomerase [Clostridium sp.]